MRLKQNFTGILAGLDFKKSLASALQLQPETRMVLVVGGTSELDKDYIAVARKDFQPFEGRVDFTYLTNLSIEEIEQRVAHPPPHSIIFCLPIYRDGAGHPFPPVESAARIAKASYAPYYGIAEVLVIPWGGVGGYLWSFEAEAMEAAKLARRILAGEKPRISRYTLETRTGTSLIGVNLDAGGLAKREYLPVAYCEIKISPSGTATSGTCLERSRSRLRKRC